VRTDESLYAILEPVFGTELYPIHHPDPDGLRGSVSDLFATYTQIGGQMFDVLRGEGGIDRVRYQISIFGIDYEQVKQKETAARAALSAANDAANALIDSGEDVYNTPGCQINISGSVPLYGYENDTKRYSCFMDYYLWEKL